MTVPRDVPAVVLGSGLTQLGVVRTLGRAGIPVRVASDQDDFVRRSRWYVPAPPRVAGEALTDYLDRLPYDRTVLIACSDSATLEVACLPSDVAARHASSVPAPDALKVFVDKLGFAGLLRRIDVPHPHTQEISGREDLERVPEEVLSGTSFLKPRDSQRFFATFGVKGFRVASRAEAEARLDQIERAGLTVVLQEYVPGPFYEHFFLDGFRDATGTVRVRFARRRLRMYPPDFGNSTCTASVALDDVAGAVRSMDAILDATRYRGIFSAEFKRDVRDGVFKILEVNARPWWYVEFAARAGADVVTRCYRDALGLPVSDARPYRVGAMCIYPYYDYFACAPLRRAGTMSFSRMLAEWGRAYQPILAADDPRPWMWQMWRTGRASIGARIRRRSERAA